MQANILPDYHFLLIASNLGGEYLFDASRAYWESFQPVVIPDTRFLEILPTGRTITVTVVALRDTAAQIGVDIARAAPFAFYDPVVYDTLDETRAEMNRRAGSNQPFGVPLGIGFATTTPFIPTPAITLAPGFITATPNGTGTAAPSATPQPATPAGTAATQTPLNTPGPIIGGG
jgi:hypothetical protein